MAVLSEQAFTIVVAEPQVTGRINAIRYWNEDDQDWRFLYTYDGGLLAPPTLVKGRKLSLCVDWQNTSPAAVVKGHVDVDITRPDGSSVRLTATQGQDETIYPGGIQVVVFEDALTLDQVGSYSGTVTLTGVAV